MKQGDVTSKFYVVNEGNALIQRDGVVLGEQPTGERQRMMERQRNRGRKIVTVRETWSMLECLTCRGIGDDKRGQEKMMSQKRGQPQLPV